jgi:hypothetical protein
MPRRHPQPRGAPPPLPRFAPPPIVTGQAVADTHGAALLATLQGLILLMGGAQGDNVGTKAWVARLPSSPQAGSVPFLSGPMAEDTLVTAILGSGNNNVGFSTSGMTSANYAGLDDGGILWIGTWLNAQQIFYPNWIIRKGQTMTVSKNQAAIVDFTVWYRQLNVV